MDVNDVVAAKVEAARARAEATKRRRATQQAARQAGLTARHRTKLARLDAAEANSVPANGITAAEKGSVPANEPLSIHGADGTPDALTATEPTEAQRPRGAVTVTFAGRVRALHRDQSRMCAECGAPWPCPTFSAYSDWVIDTAHLIVHPTEGTTTS